MRILALLGLLAGVLPASVLAADVPAVVGWSQRVELGTLVSGVVAAVHVRPGQAVAKGDKLVSLDDRGFAARVERSNAELRHANAVLEEAKREDERAAELYDRTLLSDFERNQAKVALEAARAAAGRSRAALVESRLDLERSVIRAPFDGVVLALGAAPGQSVVSELQSQAMVTVADTQNLHARAQIDPAQAGQLQPGAALRASLRGQAIEARVGYVGFEPVAQTGQGPRYELTAELLADPGRPLRVGETVILHLD